MNETLFSKLKSLLGGKKAADRSLKERIPYDPKTQEPVIRSSICTGEKVAGFKDRKTGKFIDVMLIRDEEDKKRFMEIYGIDKVTTTY